MAGINLQTLFPELRLPEGLSSVLVNDLTLDSRKVNSGTVFFALKGTTTNREEFIEQAFSAGAVAVVKEAPIEPGGQVSFENDLSGNKRIVISVPSLKQRLGEIASIFFGQPSRCVCLVGVTGTNGKTSCADLLLQLWRKHGFKAASIGTLGWSVEPGEYHATGLTTPDAIENQRIIRGFVNKGITHVVMEVSSHGIDQVRIGGLDFDAKLLTNITRDHLDYHGSMEQYAKTKLSFLLNGDGTAIWNADDTETKKWLPSASNDHVLYGCNNQAAVFAKNVECIPEGMKGELSSPWGHSYFKVGLIGQFNLYNVLAVIAVFGATSESVDLQKLIQSVAALLPVPGRLERIPGNKLVFVDFAHTPDALKNVLAALAQHCKENIFLVFGCGGNRDKGKRPLMAEVAQQYASKVIVTTDNPRDEVPEQIIEDIALGFSSEQNVLKIVDRKEAIKCALQLAGEHDVVLVAGKGHEAYQEIKGVKHPYSDAQEVHRLIA